MRYLILVLALLGLSVRAHAVVSPTFTATATPTFSQTSTVTPTFTQTVTPSITKTSTITPSITQTSTRTVTPTFSQTPSSTVTPTLTITRTLTPTATARPFTGPQNELVQPNGTPVPYANTYKPFSAASVSAVAKVWPPASGKKFRLLGFTLAGSVAGDYVLFDNANTIFAVTLPAGISFNAPLPGNGTLSAVSNTPLTIHGPVGATTPCTASGAVYGTEE